MAVLPTISNHAWSFGQDQCPAASRLETYAACGALTSPIDP